ncbi:hypothetical protein CEE37_09615 [candidate division LCP-89 bacterium B3_LCP]|uniref:Secretion system C-terminal sorting domain-containing protein n=1 Tax=candidate division LCP-89 bacterium B3_LCP TaxID=2012998 RepID=A0A532UYF4_UNCL8|nr:MAG: hypothetical protein CEE37_09615 [candidate division LCP-89 bacterium B3_LCP]
MYRILVLLLFVGLSVATSIHAQPPDTLWTNTFGGSNGDYGRSVQQTVDGGYIIAGWTYSYGAGNADVYLIKTDMAGSEVWSQTFGGSEEDYGYSVQQTTDGGYIIVGETYTYSAGGNDVYLIKTNAAGTEEWYKTFGGSSNDYGYSVRQTIDGGYIIAGYTWSYGAGNTDVYLIKTNAAGNEVWYQTFGGSSHYYGHSVQQTTDGGYIIAGYTWSYGAGNTDVYLIKTNAAGSEVWYQTFGESSNEIGYSVQQTTDGGYIIAGFTSSYDPYDANVYLIKTNAAGSEVWSQTFGGSGEDIGKSIQQTTDGGYIIAGYTYSYGAGERDVYLLKTDAAGSEVWSQTFGGGAYEHGYSVQQTADGGYIIAGNTISYGAGGYDVWLIRVDSEGTYVESSMPNQPLSFSLLGCYPNPFNPTTVLRFQLQDASKVNLAIFDISGRKVVELINGWRDAGVHEVTFNGSGLASGIYIYQLHAGGFTASGKMVLMK